MSQTHYYYTLNRKAAERIVGLTWNQFLKEFGWSRRSQWQDVGQYLDYALDFWESPGEPVPAELAPILSATIRETIPRMSPQYFCLLELSYHLRRRSFVKVDLGAHGLESQCDALMIAAVWAFLDGDIDDRTLWCVLTLHDELAAGLLDRFRPGVAQKDRRRIHAAMKRFGRCRPVFDWQTVEAVRDGHTALNEEDTRRFAAFIRLAWRKNWPLYSDGPRLLHVRDFELARKLHKATPAMRGNCLIRYWGP